MNEKRAAQRGKATCSSSHSLTLKGDEVRYLLRVVARAMSACLPQSASSWDPNCAFCLGEEDRQRSLACVHLVMAAL